MSALEVRLLTCDGVDDGEVCDAEYGNDTYDETATRSFAQIREDAKTLANWTAAHGLDYCPDHAAQAAADVAVTVLRSMIAPSGGAR